MHVTLALLNAFCMALQFHFLVDVAVQLYACVAATATRTTAVGEHAMADQAAAVSAVVALPVS